MLKILTSGRKLAARHYLSLITRARAPVFYQGFGVADTPEGRFDLLLVHLWAVLSRMREAHADSLAQQLVDRVFTGFEDSLREAGAGDTAALKALKRFADAFAGRLGAYDDAGDDASFRDALARNLYPETPADTMGPNLSAMCGYIRDLRTRLHAWQPTQEFLDFGPLPG